AAIIFAITIVGQIYLPSVSGGKRTKSNSPFTIVKNKSVVICWVVTLLTIMAHYGLYTYISPLVEYIQLSGGIKLASIISGIGTLISVVIAGKFVDRHLGQLTASMIILALASMTMSIGVKGMFIISHITIVLWGL